MSSTTAGKTIEVLRGYFATWGLTDELISDNGPQFVAHEFETFLKNNGVKHIRSPAYHPASNDAAERLVQNLKRALEKGKNDQLSLQHCIHNFLFCYRSTPQSTTGKTPEELFIKREFKTRMSLLKLSFTVSMQQKQTARQTKQSHSRLSESFCQNN